MIGPFEENSIQCVDAYEVSISTLYAVDSEEEMNEVVEEILEHNNGGLN